MPVKRSGGWRYVNERRYARIRIGQDRRETFALSGVRNDEEADARAAAIADVCDRLVRAGRADRVKVLGDALAHATSPREIEDVMATVDVIVEQGAVATGATTFKQFAEKWTSGELHRLYPDRVEDIDHTYNVMRLRKYVYPVVGFIPMARFTLDDAELTMSRLPPALSQASRRHIAQLLLRVARLATYPGKILPVCPLPRGFLPKRAPDKAKPYLYPVEEAQLLGCKEIPLARRLAYGILAREGMRASELLGSKKSTKKKGAKKDVEPLAWTDVDIEHGIVTLDENKTDDARSWALGADVVRALKAWARRLGGNVPTTSLAGPIFPRGSVEDVGHLAAQLRLDLDLADVKREKLFERSETRARIVAHHLRGTFVTLALANGKTETWVMDRTGHTTSMMISKYRRAARAAQETGLGWLVPLDEAIPELAPAKKGAKKQ